MFKKKDWNERQRRKLHNDKMVNHEGSCRQEQLNKYKKALCINLC